jgi:hypothetical protein
MSSRVRRDKWLDGEMLIAVSRRITAKGWLDHEAATNDEGRPSTTPIANRHVEQRPEALGSDSVLRHHYIKYNISKSTGWIERLAHFLGRMDSSGWRESRSIK